MLRVDGRCLWGQWRSKQLRSSRSLLRTTSTGAVVYYLQKSSLAVNVDLARIQNPGPACCTIDWRYAGLPSCNPRGAHNQGDGVVWSEVNSGGSNGLILHRGWLYRNHLGVSLIACLSCLMRLWSFTSKHLQRDVSRVFRSLVV